MSDFNWVEGSTKVKELVKSLATNLTMGALGNWTLEYPATISVISDKAILSTTTSNALTAYLLLERPANANNYILVSAGNKLTVDGEYLDEEISSIPARFAWYRQSSDIVLADWNSVQYWLSYNEDFINIVIQGDPSLDIAPYRNYLISYAYIGALESFEDSDSDDKYNFGVTVSSDEFPSQTSVKYGLRTATCITDIGMLGTRTAAPFQAHLPKFSTAWEFTDKHFIEASKWTHKYHMSDIIIYHAYDRERGKLQNVLIGDRSAIMHLDILIVDKGKPEEKQYVMFNINAPYSILNNSPNVLYGIALRKS